MPSGTAKSAPPRVSRSLPVTARLRLRHLARVDERRLDDLNRAPGVMQFLAPRPPTREDVARDLEQCLADYARWPGFGRFAVETIQGRFVGWCAATVMAEDPKRVELGYRLRPEFWGRGMATEAASALLGYCFEHLQVDEVLAETMVVNARSRAVLERIGMTPIWFGQRHFDEPVPGAEHGEVRYAMTRQQWATRRG